jgi:transposase
MTPAQRRELARRSGRRCVDERDMVTAWGASRREVCAAGREALRAGRAVRAVAREFGVSERTAHRWAQRVRAEQAGAERVREEVRAG